MCFVRIYISLEDINTENVLSKTHYVGVTNLAAEDVEKKIRLILDDLKGDGFSIRSVRRKNEFVALLTLFRTIGETDLNIYVDAIKAFASDTDLFPLKSDLDGFLITIKDHSFLKAKDLEDIIAKESLQYELIAETATQFEHGTGDFFAQFIIALSSVVTAEALKMLLSKVKAKLGPSKYSEITASRFRFATLISNICRETSIAKENLQVIELQKLHKQKYEVTLLSKKSLLYVRCDQNANILGISEHAI